MAIPQEKPSFTQRVLAPMALLLGSSLFCLVLLEIGFRVFSSLAVPPPQWSDRPRHYYFQEGAVNYQDYIYSKQKPPGTFRIAVVGDSFTYGEKLQNDDTLPKRLERFLNLNSSQPKVEVMNFGVPGYSTRSEVRLARQAIVSWDADLVLLQITLNDPELVPKSAADRNRDETGKLKLSQPIFQYWKSLAFVLERLNNSASHEDYQDYFFDLFENPKSWNNFRAGLDEFSDTVRKRDRQVFAFVFPLLSHPLDERYPFMPLHQKIATQLDANKIPYVDLFPAFHGVPQERLVVEPGKDRHPNEIANRIAAEALLLALAKTDLIPAAAVPKHVQPHKLPLPTLTGGRAFE